MAAALRRAKAVQQQLRAQLARAATWPSPSPSSSLAPAAPPAAPTATPPFAPRRRITVHGYDHCPFCVRVVLALGWRGIEYEYRCYSYGDVEGPKAVHPKGLKALPVLELTQLNAPGQESPEATATFLAESLDIVQLVETFEDGDGATGARLAPAGTRPDLKAWKKRLKPVLRPLARPRVIQLPIGDFATDADVAYARSKYEQQGFNYEKALADTAKHVAAASELLLELGGMLVSSSSSPTSAGNQLLSLNRWGLSMDDLLLLPDLRTLTAVPGIEWPPRVRQYVDVAFALAGVDLYDAHAS